MLESHKLDNIKYLAGKESDVETIKPNSIFANFQLTVFTKALIQIKILEVITVDISKITCVLYLEKVYCDLQLHFARAVCFSPSLYCNNNVCEKSKRLAVNKGQKVHVCLT